MKTLLSILGLAAVASMASATLRINEAHWNPTGSDDGLEWIEILSSTPSESLAGCTLIVIEGDNVPSGIVDTVIDLTPAGATGTNSLMLWRDANIVALSPAPAAATTLLVEQMADIENGTVTFMIVRGWTGSIGGDLDTNNDGVFDSTPWTSVDSAVGFYDGNDTTNDRAYGAAVGGVDFPVLPPFTPQAYNFIPGGVGHAMLQLQSASGPFPPFNGNIADLAGAFLTPPGSWTGNPGNVNMGFTSIVAPSSYTVVTGFNFGGNLASLANSDNSKVIVLCDAAVSIAKVEITATGILTASALTAKCEISATRSDCSVFTRVKRVSSGLFEDIDFRLSSLFDVAYSAPILNPGDFLDAGVIVGEIEYIPNEDLIAVDGWTCSIDQFVFEVTP